MQYIVTGEFVKINETTGTIQNNSQINDVEVSNKAEVGSGIWLHPFEKFSFSEVSLYARCVTGGWAVINVVPFVVDAGGTSDGLDNFFLADDYDANEGIGTLKEIIDVQINSTDSETII